MASPAPDPRVVVVGAGMAGLAAAVELTRSRTCEVIVLEAMDSPGGRIQTIKGFGERVVELGANWLHGTRGNPLYKLAKKHNLLSQDKVSRALNDDSAIWFRYDDNGNEHYQTEDGESIDPKVVRDVKRMYAEVQEEFDSIDPEALDPGESFRDVMLREFTQRLEKIEMHSKKLLDQYWVVFEFCCRMECLDLGSYDLHEVQFRSALQYEELEGFYYTTLGEEGYQGVISKLLEDIPESSILYNTPVARIQYQTCGDNGKESVVVHAEDGRTFECSHVIVTSSVGFLKENLGTFFDPPLPKDKLQVLRSLPFGTVNKIFLKYDKPFWTSEEFGVQLMWREPSTESSERDEEAEKAVFFRTLVGFDAEEKNSDILLGWTYGKGAEFMETLSDEELGKRCTSLLRQFLGDPTIPEPASVMCSRWHSNRYQRGSYAAFFSLHSSCRNHDIMNAPVYSSSTEGKQKVPILCFAGEAFHKIYFSTTHGAFLSGRDQARALIKYLSRRHGNTSKCLLN
ncbi:peroxisomal N(1)-acetyl-spermine/spermidine oxidase-like isoform X1 [Diadema antillarum]|uniref:peroxisomal N(1)-acetyl-spermine/spermidine oxidase-like isoform X1 n=1 Tax=Diadema antillarum TaxID=105358 RepID=UPI003A87D811